MLKRARAVANRWALQGLGRDWVDYIASNTMTHFNRQVNGFLWTYDLKAQVLAVRDEAEDVKTLVLLPNQHWHTATPGQHVALTVTVDGETLTRYYSLTPLADGTFTLTIKRVPGGRVSSWIHDHLQAGMVVNLGHAQGRFQYQGQRKLLFLCAGSGITPCHSIIEALRAQGARPDIRVYAQFSNEDGIIFADALKAWGSEFPVDLALSRPHQRTGNHTQPLSAATFGGRLPDFRDRDIYLCGPAGFMEAIVAMLRSHDYDLSRLHSERFVAVDHGKAAPGDFQADGAEIHFRHLDARITLTAEDQGRTLMQVAERHGVNLETGCRKGMCGTCKLTLKDGQVSGNTLGQAVYLCTSYPASAKLVLDA